MFQINFRVEEDEKNILEEIARIKNVSLAELSKQMVLTEIATLRVDLAFELLENGKISKKKAWLLSGLSYYEFITEGARRKVYETIPVEIIESELESIHELDLSQFLKDSETLIKKPLI